MLEKGCFEPSGEPTAIAHSKTSINNIGVDKSPSRVGKDDHRGAISYSVFFLTKERSFRLLSLTATGDAM